MKSILGLFKETKDILPTRLKYFSNDIFDKIPIVDYPSFNSEEFDIEEVERCHCRPSLSTSFLRNSDEAVSKVFMDYCNGSDVKNIDWNKVSEILEDVEVIIGKLKNRFQRPRPSNFMSQEYNIKYKDSPSYPSGHTTVAYFLCDLLSNSVPEIKQDLQTLASLIGQSRIENAVHYPSDINYGRLVGETLCQKFLEEDEHFKSQDLHIKILEHCEKNNIDKAEYSKEIAEFLLETNINSGINCNYSDCLEASQSFLMGYPINYITEHKGIKSVINCMIAANKFKDIDREEKLIEIHKQLDVNVLSSLPGQKRTYDNLDNLFKNKSYEKYRKVTESRPFLDGNVRVGKVMLIKDLNFDFYKYNRIIMK